MNRSELDKLSNQLGMASTRLGNKGKYSREIDNLINEYEYGGLEDGFEENPESREQFVEKAKAVLKKYDKNTLQLQDFKIVFQKDVIQIRKKRTSKTKPKRKIVKSVGDKK
jgi:hypothetical protein